ncbi:MAG: GAF domain-containing protein [Chloroflexi bacterium]|nr:GAF domain-containing protein [Chloroflexota bacterium]
MLRLLFISLRARLILLVLLALLPSVGLTLYTGLEQGRAIIGVALTETNQLLMRQLLFIGFVTLVTLLITAVLGELFILRPLRALVLVTRELAAGNLSTRAGRFYGVGELYQLAQAFDEMVDALKRREIENRQAAEEIRRQSVHMQALAGFSRTLAEATLNSESVLDIAVHACDELTNAGCVLRLFSDDGQRLNAVRVYHSVPEMLVLLNKISTGVQVPEAFSLRWKQVLERGSPWTGPLTETGLIPAVVPSEHEQGAMMLIPMQLHGHAIGLMEFWRLEGDMAPFGPDELKLAQDLGDRAALAITNARLFEEGRRRGEFLQALRDIDIAIISSFDLRLTLNVFLERMMERLKVDAAHVLLFDPDAQKLEVAVARGFRTSQITTSQVRLGEGLAGRAALERRMISAPQLADGAPLLQAALFSAESFQAYFVVPLMAKEQLKGVLEIYHRVPLAPDDEWLGFLETFSGQAAIAIDNVNLFDNLQRANMDLTLAYDATIEGWSHALGLRDRETEGHSKRVTDMTLHVAQAVGVSEADLVHIRRGALLHDIGKMAIPDSILFKPGELTYDEWTLMRQHPMYAYEMLLPINFLRPALDIPYYHHEKWDGTGYPVKLKGEQIPLAARIFSVVDVWDALRSDRPYRKAWPEVKVRAYIQGQSGIHFDPPVVEALLATLDRLGDLISSPLAEAAS